MRAIALPKSISYYQIGRRAVMFVSQSFVWAVWNLAVWKSVHVILLVTIDYSRLQLSARHSKQGSMYACVLGSTERSVVSANVYQSCGECLEVPSVALAVRYRSPADRALTWKESDSSI